MITVTDAAQRKIREILAEESDPTLKVRAFVQGGGCSGFQYGFTLDETVAEDDIELKYEEISVLVDAMSMQYLSEATIDFTEGVMGSNFKITNPQAQSTCGCGSSFSPF